MPEFTFDPNTRDAWDAVHNDSADNGFTRAYVNALFFTFPEIEEGIPELASETLAQIKADCEEFYHDFLLLFNDEYELAGRCFWYTRNGEGIGFFDAAEAFGDAVESLITGVHYKPSLTLYKGDDGLLYFV